MTISRSVAPPRSALLAPATAKELAALPIVHTAHASPITKRFVPRLMHAIVAETVLPVSSGVTAPQRWTFSWRRWGFRPVAGARG